MSNSVEYRIFRYVDAYYATHLSWFCGYASLGFPNWKDTGYEKFYDNVPLDDLEKIRSRTEKDPQARTERIGVEMYCSLLEDWLVLSPEMENEKFMDNITNCMVKL